MATLNRLMTESCTYNTVKKVYNLLIDLLIECFRCLPQQKLISKTPCRQYP